MSGANPTLFLRCFLTMKITDSMQCDIWYQALLERAVEFTGVFFVGVKTTGVFCISVCRARKPRRENVEFYNDFKSALDAGFRPCKVCRPTENARTAPAFVEQALRLLREAQRSASAIASYVSTILARNAFAAGSCKTTGSPFRLFNGCSV